MFDKDDAIRINKDDIYKRIIIMFEIQWDMWPIIFKIYK